VVATKTEEKVIDALAAVSAVRQQQIDQLGPSKLSEIFFGIGPRTRNRNTTRSRKTTS